LIPYYWLLGAGVLSLAAQIAHAAATERTRILTGLQSALSAVCALALSAVLTSWLFDVPGQLRLIGMLQRGVTDNAQLRAADAHPILQNNVFNLGVLSGLLLLLGGFAQVWAPYLLARPKTPGAEPSSNPPSRRQRTWGLIGIVAGGLLTAVSLAGMVATAR
jgi:hypothetical protein